MRDIKNNAWRLAHNLETSGKIALAIPSRMAFSLTSSPRHAVPPALLRHSVAGQAATAIFQRAVSIAKRPVMIGDGIVHSTPRRCNSAPFSCATSAMEKAFPAHRQLPVFRCGRCLLLATNTFAIWTQPVGMIQRNTVTTATSASTILVASRRPPSLLPESPRQVVPA